MHGLTEIQLMNSAARSLTLHGKPERRAICRMEIRKQVLICLALAEGRNECPIAVLDEHAKGLDLPCRKTS